MPVCPDGRTAGRPPAAPHFTTDTLGLAEGLRRTLPRSLGEAIFLREQWTGPPRPVAEPGLNEPLTMLEAVTAYRHGPLGAAELVALAESLGRSAHTPQAPRVVPLPPETIAAADARLGRRIAVMLVGDTPHGG